jgi:serine/threonine protein kinase
VIWQVGEWLVEPALDEIRRADARVKLDPRTMAVFTYLIARPGHVVSADELLDEVWKGVIVTQGSVYQAIAVLRRALDDDSSEPRYIVNVPRKGYRLIAPVSRATQITNTPITTASSTSDIPDWPAELPHEFDGLQILRRVGEGSAGRVFVAREVALERLVAIKVLRPELLEDPVARARLQREALAAARITHPNVATIYRVGELANGALYIAQEYIEGRTLADVLRLEGVRPIDECVAVLRDLAQALAAADAKRIIHRDVRPGNVIIERDTRRVVLTDFGVAALQETGRATLERLTRAGEQLGDPRYASPEHVRGESLTAASDVYSLGVLAYELITGRGPYEASEPRALADAHVTAAPLDLAAVRGEVSRELANLLQRCLAKQADERPTAEELARWLATRGVVSGAPQDVRAAPPPTTSPSPAAPLHRGWYAAAALVILVLAVAAWRWL